MRFVESNEIHEWAAEHALGLTSQGSMAVPEFAYSARESFAPDMSSAEAGLLAVAALASLGPFTEALVEVTDWGIWPSSEDWPRYYAWRGTLGEKRSLEKAPGLLLEGGERIQASEALAHAILNGWDALAVFASARDVCGAIRVSHDEFILVAGPTPTSIVRVAV